MYVGADIYVRFAPEAVQYSSCVRECSSTAINVSQERVWDALFTAQPQSLHEKY